MAPAGPSDGRETAGSVRGRSLAERNRRTALVLLGWIVALVAASVAVVWVRN